MEDGIIFVRVVLKKVGMLDIFGLQAVKVTKVVILGEYQILHHKYCVISMNKHQA